MKSTLPISRLHVGLLAIGGVIALLAQEWAVGITVLGMAVGTGVFVFAIEWWDRNRRRS